MCFVFRFVIKFWIIISSFVMVMVRNVFTAKGLQHPAYPMFIISRILGAAPYRLSPNGTLQISYLWLTYSWILRVTIEGSTFYLRFEEAKMKHRAKIDPMEKFFALMWAYVPCARNILMHGNILIMHHKGLLALLNKWLSQAFVPSLKISRHLQVVEWLVLCTYIFGLCFAKAWTVILSKYLPADVKIYSIATILNLNSITIVPFIFCVVALRQQFLQVNRQLKAEADLIKKNGALNFSVNTTINRSKTSYVADFDGEPVYYYGVSAVRRRHAFLVCITEKVNSLYTMSSLSMVFFNLFQGLSLASRQNIKAHLGPDTLLWWWASCFPLICTLLVCQSTAKQANRAVKLVHTAMNLSSITAKDREQLELFSVQLIHRQCHFDVLGCFHLNMKLLPSIIGWIFTNVIIILQFKMMLARDQF